MRKATNTTQPELCTALTVASCRSSCDLKGTIAVCLLDIKRAADKPLIGWNLLLRYITWQWEIFSFARFFPLAEICQIRLTQVSQVTSEGVGTASCSTGFDMNVALLMLVANKGASQCRSIRGLSRLWAFIWCRKCW